MNNIQELPRQGIVPVAGRMSVAEVTQHAIAVQEVMQAVMKKDVHYGVIPFTDKPTLYKAGAEKLCMTFRIADEYQVQDLSTSDLIRYRVNCIGRHQLTGVELGSGMGEGSTSEEKYKWRKAVCKEEFDATPVDMRRVKYAKGKNNTHYTAQQVRTEPSDLANTVLKMACKRAKMAMVLNVTAASDCFTQDIEDLDTVLQEHLAGDGDGEGQQQTGEPKAPPTWPDESFKAQLPRWEKAVQAGMKSVDDILALAKSKGALTAEQDKQIRGIKPAQQVEEAAQPKADALDPFVAEMEAAEQEGTQ